MELYRFMQMDTTYIDKAARCLAETFAGVHNGNYLIAEPVAVATKLTVDDFTEFFRIYFESTYQQGYHFIAIDNQSDEVVGVVGVDICDPEEEVLPPYEGKFEVMNRLTEVLEPLDALLIEKFEYVLQRKLKKDELLHGFLIGVNTPKNKRFVSKKLVSLVLEKGEKQGMKGVFVEATNPRSQSLLKQECNAYIPTDVTGKSIMIEYKDDPFFHVIPPEISEDLQILYIEIDPTINLK